MTILCSVAWGLRWSDANLPSENGSCFALLKSQVCPTLPGTSRSPSLNPAPMWLGIKASNANPVTSLSTTPTCGSCGCRGVSHDSHQPSIFHGSILFSQLQLGRSTVKRVGRPLAAVALPPGLSPSSSSQDSETPLSWVLSGEHLDTLSSVRAVESYVGTSPCWWRLCQVDIPKIPL
jgi:hypothetical protein